MFDDDAEEEEEEENFEDVVVVFLDFFYFLYFDTTTVKIKNVFDQTTRPQKRDDDVKIKTCSFPPLIIILPLLSAETRAAEVTSPSS